MKVLAVGDIHTKVEIIDQVEEVLDNYDKVVFIGDYADDWGKEPTDTINAWNRLRTLQGGNPDKVKVLIGNHDYAYILGFNPMSGGYNPITLLQLSSLDNRNTRTWLKTLPITLEIDGVTYSHAGVDESWDGEETPESLWADNSPLWTRPGDSSYVKTPQVFGHTPCATCYEVEPNIWCIDTFSTYRYGENIGDSTVLEIIDGKQFNVIEIDRLKNDNDNNPNGISD